MECESFGNLSNECLGLMDLDLVLEDTPTEPTDSSSPEEKSKNQGWERSNRMSLLLMKCKMSKTSAAVPRNDNAN
ncbi:hypothetical protein WN943_002482 [Citrus x changshan-huyou]